MAITIDRSSPKPMYEQIYQSIKYDILSGRMNEGEKLPSKRALAERLEVSKITVENAYAQLIAEGYVYSAERSGYFVQYNGGAIPLLQHSKPHMEEGNFDAAFEPKEEANTGTFPFSIWSRLMRDVISEKGTELLKPVRSGGAAELRRAISGYLYRAKGFYQPPERIIIGSGSEQMYNFLIQLLGADKKYGYEDPGLVKLPKICELSRVEHSSVRIDGQGLNVSELYEKGIGVAIATPAHQYPTGIVMPVSRRCELIRWVDETGGYLIEDDYDGEFRFEGLPIPTMFGADTTGRIIYMKTFSQTISRTIRISYACLSEELYALWREKLGFYSCSVPVFEQFTLAKFINDGYYERNINRCRKHYKRIRDLLRQKAAQYPEFDYYGAEAGIYIVVRAPHFDEKVSAFVKRCGLTAKKLNEYCFDGVRCDDDLYIINFANANPDEIMK